MKISKGEEDILPLKVKYRFRSAVPLRLVYPEDIIGNEAKLPLQPTEQIAAALGLEAPRHFSLGVISST